MKPRFQFRLRTLLILVTVLGAASGYVAHEYETVTERLKFLDASIRDLAA